LEPVQSCLKETLYRYDRFSTGSCFRVAMTLPIALQSTSVGSSRKSMSKGKKNGKKSRSKRKRDLPKLPRWALRRKTKRLNCQTLSRTHSCQTIRTRRPMPARVRRPRRDQALRIKKRMQLSINKSQVRNWPMRRANFTR